jgi:hypothetical protein
VLAGFCAFGISFFIVVWYILKVNKKINSCWNRLLQKVQDKYSVLKGIAIDRLAQYHSIYSLDEEETNHRPKNSKLNFKFHYKYLIRFSILFILSISVCLIIVLIYYNNIQNYLNYRLNFISAIGNMRTKLVQLSYFTIQQTAFRISFDTQSVYNLTLSPDILFSFNRTNEVLLELRREIQSPLVYNHIPSEVWNMLYSQLDQYKDFLKFGALSGIDYYRYESIYAVSYDFEYTGFSIVQYFDELSELIAVLTNITSVADKNSKTQIENELNSLIYFTVFVLLFFIFLYTFYYFPYITKQQEMVKKIEFVMKTIPETHNIK